MHWEKWAPEQLSLKLSLVDERNEANQIQSRSPRDLSDRDDRTVRHSEMPRHLSKMQESGNLNCAEQGFR
ncbi:unnamed protein product [Soboliphyme baturini]|uniref:Uncharacterized protein n=1 Tax=Soboliphyme baturini TaxID=241478 RepID=A0A183IKI5_9BILA|nr:unnamed protein product [Soboliphyme baturini]